MKISFLNYYLGTLMGLGAIAAFFGPRQGEPIAYFASGMMGGISIMIIGIEVIISLANVPHHQSR